MDEGLFRRLVFRFVDFVLILVLIVVIIVLRHGSATAANTESGSRVERRVKSGHLRERARCFDQRDRQR